MNSNKYVYCPKCGLFSNFEDRHYETCQSEEAIENYIDGVNICCYACGRQDVEYSDASLEKKELAVCKRCEKNCRTKKYFKYEYLWSYNTHQVHKLSIDRQLVFYVREFNINKIKELLKKGANANYIHKQDTIRNYGYHYILLYNNDGSSMNENNNNLTDTNLLEHCITEFRWTYDVDDEQLCNKIIKSAKLLLDHGANKKTGKDFFESYLGKFTEKDGLKYTFYSIFE
jgi:hypothetical protein